MKKLSFTLLSIFVILLLALTAAGVFSLYSATAPKQSAYDGIERLVNYNEDGSGTVTYENTSKSGIYFANESKSLVDCNTLTNVVIFICFSDENITTVRNGITSKLTSGFNGQTQSLYDYYYQLSYGALSVNTIFPLNANSAYYIYRDTHPRSYYTSITATEGNARFNPEIALVNNALKAADAFFDYTGIDLDANDDGFADCVSFIISKNYVNTQKNWGTLMWPHASTISNLEGTLNSVKVKEYTFTFAENFNLGLIAHETAHLLGLYDLYNGDKSQDNYPPVGSWDLMHVNNEIPQFTTTYLRYKYLGFADKSQIQEITNDGTYTLKPTASAQQDETLAYRITINDQESIWMEYRNKNASIYENGLPSSGLIVYRVNNSVTGNTKSQRQNVSYPYEVFVFRPNCGSDKTETYNLSRAALSITNSDFHSLGSSLSNTPYNPNCIYLTNGENTYIAIDITEQTNEKISFSVSLEDKECVGMTDAYVSGVDLKGKSTKNKHYAYVNEKLDVGIFVKYEERSTYVEITNFTLEYEDKFCPEGQTAYAVFSDAYGEHRLPFTLYLYNIVIESATLAQRPLKLVYSVNDTIDLRGLAIDLKCASGRTVRIDYSEENKDCWKIIEGLDMTKIATYDHIKITYDNSVSFYLSGVKVIGEIKSLRIDEKNTSHIKSTTQKAVFNVIGVYNDGTEKTLTEDEYTVIYRSAINFQKSLVDIISTSNVAIRCSTFCYFTTNATIEAITPESNVRCSVKYGQMPDFSKGKISVKFSNGYSINGENALPMENYYDLICKSYLPKKVGVQTLSCTVDNANFGATVTVYPKSNDILSVADASQQNGNIILENNRILLKTDVTLSEIYAYFNSYLTIKYEDVAGKYELIPTTYAGHYVGNNVKLSLISENGVTIAEYTIYREGDGDGDGLVTEADKTLWTNTLLCHNFAVQFDMDSNGEYTLTDFVLLLEKYGGTANEN